MIVGTLLLLSDTEDHERGEEEDLKNKESKRISSNSSALVAFLLKSADAKVGDVTWKLDLPCFTLDTSAIAAAITTWNLRS